MLPRDRKKLLAKYLAINFKNQMKQLLYEVKLQCRNNSENRWQENRRNWNASSEKGEKQSNKDGNGMLARKKKLQKIGRDGESSDEKSIQNQVKIKSFKTIERK